MGQRKNPSINIGCGGCGCGCLTFVVCIVLIGFILNIGWARRTVVRCISDVKQAWNGIR